MAQHPFSHFQPATALYHPENAVALAHAASLAYQDEAVVRKVAKSWGFPRCQVFSKRETDGFVLGNKDAVVVAFRGTEPATLRDWMTDLDCEFRDGPFSRVHSGFARALEYVRADIDQAIRDFQDNAQSLWFTGHSLGAALATLAVAHLREADKPVHGLYNFGAPRAGDRVFERTFNQDFGPRCFRFVNGADLVTRVPMRTMGFSHVGRLMYFDNDGQLSVDPGWWDRFLNGVECRLDDLGKLGPAALKQHGMDGYIKRVEKNRGANPF
jgi:triacylglycerol lipase